MADVIPWGTIVWGAATAIVSGIGGIAGLIHLVVKQQKEIARKDREIGALYKERYKTVVLDRRLARSELERRDQGTPSSPPVPASVRDEDFDDNTGVINALDREDDPFFAPLRIQAGLPHRPPLEGFGGRQDYQDRRERNERDGYDTPAQITPPRRRK